MYHAKDICYGSKKVKRQGLSKRQALFVFHDDIAQITRSFIGRRWLIMKTLLWIIGIILALPILLTIVALIVVTLIGGYITAILYWGWWIVASIILIILIIKIIKFIF